MTTLPEVIASYYNLQVSNDGKKSPMNRNKAQGTKTKETESKKSCWMKLFENTPSMILKKESGKDINKPTPIYLKDLENKRIFTEEKEKFLFKKTKREQKNELFDSFSNEVKEIINEYGDVNANIKMDLVEKYILYKKYEKGLNKA